MPDDPLRKRAFVGDRPEYSKKFSDGNVKAVFEGHDHVFNHQTHDGIEYYIAGGAGAPLDTSPDKGGFFHYLLVHVKGDSFDVTVIPLGAIDLRQEGDDIRVSSYAAADIPLGDLVVASKRAPKSVTAQVDAKGTLKSIPVALTSVVKAKRGYQVHLSLVLPKAGQTFIHLN